jgi:hypothetical protein
MPIIPLSEEEYKIKQKEEEVGFFESALAGVATGLWNIPKGFVSLGAELYDLVGDTNTAKNVEKWFDDVNPWDDEAEARTVGKITQALTQVGIPAIKGAQIGASLAARAISAKKNGNFMNLGRIGEKIMSSEKGFGLAGAVVGGGVGEALVADEDIGTFADMLRGTSLEPYALTMMDTQEKEGREDAYRKLLNRVKFGTEGALFNLALIGAGKGIQKLRNPSLEGASESLEGIRGDLQKFGPEGGFSPHGLGTKQDFESKQYFDGLKKATAAAADNTIKEIDTVLKKVNNTFYDEFLKEGKLRSKTPIYETSGEDLLRKELQDVISPSDKSSYQRLLKPEARKRAEEQLILAKQFNQVEKDYLENGKLGPSLDSIKKNYIKDTTTTARDEYVNIQKSLLGREPTVDDLKLFKKEASEKILSTSPEIKQLEREAFANIDLLDVDKRIAALGREATPKELAQIEREAFNTLEAFSKKIKEKGVFTVDDYAVTDKFKNILNKLKKGGFDDVKLKESVLNARLSLDNLSGKLFLQNIDPDKAKTILQNLGRYSTAVYRRSETKGMLGLSSDYAVTAAEKARGVDKYIDMELQKLRKEEVNKQLVSLGRRATPEELYKFEKEAIEKISPTSKEFESIKDSAIQEINTFANKVAKDEVVPFELDKSDVSSKDLKNVKIENNILKTKLLNAWQEEVYGIIRDPSYNFLASSGKIANLNFTIDYLNQIYKQGSKSNGYIKSAAQLNEIDPSGKLINDTNKWKLFTNKTNVPTALDGMYIEAPKYDAILDVTSNMLNSRIGTFYKYAVLGPKAASQIVKTILSPLTHVRNLISASAFVSANGAFWPNYGDIKLLLPQSLGGENVFKQAYGLTGKRIFGTMTKADEALYQRLLKVGVVDSQVQASEMKQLIRDILTDPAAVEKGLYDKLPKALDKSKSSLRKVYGKIQDAYVAEDDFWKIINWNLERNRYSGIVDKLGINKNNIKAILDGDQKVIKSIKNGDIVAEYFKKITPRKDYINSGINSSEIYENFLDEIAGNLTRNQVPNYNYIGRTARALRLTPFGNFISFPLEIMRTGNNILTQSIDEISSGIPELVGLGYKRLFSFGATVGGIPIALTEMFKTKNDVTTKEMDALRRIGVPEWSKNSTLLPMGRDENGYIKYIDFSYSNAYDVLIRPINSLLNSISDGVTDKSSLTKSLGDGLIESMNEILKPYASESIFTEALFDSVLRNGIGRDGKKVWNNEDEPIVKVGKAVLHIGETFKPGFWEQSKRLGQAATGKTNKYGDLYNFNDEISALWGMRTIQSDPEKSLVYMTTRFGSQLKDDDNLFKADLLKGGRVSPENIINRYAYSESRKFNTMKEMYKNIEAARTLGVTENKIRNTIKRKGIDVDLLNQLFRGVYTPEKPSDFFIDRISRINRDLNNKEGVEKPNPYFEALPKINEIINRNRRVNLLDGEFSIYKDLEQLNEQNNQQQRLPTPGVSTSKEIVLPNKQNQQTNTATGLTETQTALLSPGDQIIQQRLNKNKPITLVG